MEVYHKQLKVKTQANRNQNHVEKILKIYYLSLTILFSFFLLGFLVIVPDEIWCDILLYRPT